MTVAFKDILLSLNTHPDPAPLAAVQYGVKLAARLSARISCVIWELKIQNPSTVHFLANTLLDLPALLEAEMKKSAAHARGLAHAFEQAARQDGVFGRCLLRRCSPVEAPDLLCEHARLHDVTIIPLMPDDEIAHMHAEAAIFGAGRPILVVPESAFGKDVKLERVVIGWDRSRPAARALSDGLPLLAAASEVHAVTIENEKPLKDATGRDELVRHLAEHGITPRTVMLDAAGRSAGEVLLEYVRSIDADLLVMGAYGHSRVQQFVLGGVTRTMLRSPPVPLLMSH